MATLQTIAIIGVGDQTGSSIVRALCVTRHRLLLIDDEYEKTLSLKKEVEDAGRAAELIAMDCAKEACWEADIIILAAPHEAQREVAEKISKFSIGKVVISASTAHIRGYRELLVAPNRSAVEELQKLLPYSKIVKALNICQPAEGTAAYADRGELLIAGNSGDAVDVVVDMAKAAGYRPVVVGDLTSHRTLETTQVRIIGAAIRNKATWLSGWKSFCAGRPK